MVNSSKSNPIHPIGSDVNLTCTVALNPAAVDVPVTVNIVWMGPAGVTFSSESIDHVMKKTTLHLEGNNHGITPAGLVLTQHF